MIKSVLVTVLASAHLFLSSCGKEHQTSQLDADPVLVKDHTIGLQNDEYECTVENDACKKPGVIKFKQNRDTRVEVENVKLIFEADVNGTKVKYSVDAKELEGAYGNDGEKTQKILEIKKVKALKDGDKDAREVDLSTAKLQKIKFKAKTTEVFSGRGKLDIYITARDK